MPRMWFFSSSTSLNGFLLSWLDLAVTVWHPHAISLGWQLQSWPKLCGTSLQNALPPPLFFCQFVLSCHRGCCRRHCVLVVVTFFVLLLLFWGCLYWWLLCCGLDSSDTCCCCCCCGCGDYCCCIDGRCYRPLVLFIVVAVGAAFVVVVFSFVWMLSRSSSLLFLLCVLVRVDSLVTSVLPICSWVAIATCSCHRLQGVAELRGACSHRTGLDSASQVAVAPQVYHGIQRWSQHGKGVGPREDHLDRQREVD